jgi:hypothetical protein
MRFSAPDQIRPWSGNPEDGFSLIEVVVASGIMGMVITGVMTLIGIGRGLETESLLRRQALEMAATKLEDPKYQNPLVGAEITPIDPEISYINLKTAEGTDVAGQMTLVVSPTLDDAWAEIGGGTLQVPHQRLTVTVQWGFGGASDQVVLRKRVAAIR